MEDTNKKIDQHVRLQRFKIFKCVIAILVLLSIPGGYAIYNLSSPVIERTMLTGVLESLHHGQSVAGTDTDQLYVRLSDGKLVNVPIGRGHGVPFKRFAEVKIEKTVKASGKVYFEFRLFSGISG